jgi:hypothetical protein
MTIGAEEECHGTGKNSICRLLHGGDRIRFAAIIAAKV